jgi:hypothetical protein
MFNKIRILGNGFPNGTTIEIDGNPLKFALKAKIEIDKDQFTTVSLLDIGEIDVETDGIVYIYTPDGRKFKVIEETLSSRCGIRQEKEA